MVMTSDIRRGMFIIYKGEPHIVLERLFTTRGRVSAFNKTKLKSLISGRVLQQTFKSTDKVEEIDVETKSMQFIYVDGDSAYFMDPQSFEQIPIPVGNIPGGTNYLHADAKYVTMFYEDEALSVKLPFSIKLKVASTIGAVKGNTAQAATKVAELETGMEVQVPLFIEEGDFIVVNTDSGEYIEKVR